MSKWLDFPPKTVSMSSNQATLCICQPAGSSDPDRHSLQLNAPINFFRISFWSGVREFDWSNEY